MRKANKASLRNKILKFNHSTVQPNGDVTVVDGGAALHKTPWTLHSTYGECADAFVRYVASKHGYNKLIHVVFDGYDDPLSLKTTEHERRGQTTASNVTVTNDAKVT
jgi:hypothetical protein